MPRPQGRTWGREQLGPLTNIEMQKWVEARVNLGMITMIDAADIEPGALQLVKNATVRFDKTSRRPGSVPAIAAKPNSSPVLKLASLKSVEGFAHTVRMTPTTIHHLVADNWVALDDANAMGEELAGTITDRFNTAVILNRLVFANNGVNHIQEVDFAGGEFKRLGNAPKYRYLCGFYNRVVGAALRDVNEVQIGWSGDGVAEEWDPLVDESAGFTPLYDSTSDLSDFITGIFAFTNTMLILREKSVWMAGRQPIPQDPFVFRAIIPGVGCGAPHSAANISDGIAWFDPRTAAVYAYSLGGQFESIGKNIERDIVNNIDDPSMVFAAYNPVPQEYTLYIPQAGSKTIVAWTYNFRGKTWAYNEYYDLFSADDIETGSPGLTIDGLGAVPIDSLEGTIDDLSPTSGVAYTRVYGYGDGNTNIEDVNSAFDAPHEDHPTGVEYETDLISKVFTIPSDDVYIAEIRFEYIATIGGPFTIEYSRTGGEGIDAWRIAKTIDPNVLGVPRVIKYKRLIRCRRFAWRLRSKRGLFDLLSYEVHVYRAGDSRK